MKYFTLIFFHVTCYQAHCRSLEPTKLQHSKDQATLNEDRSARVHRVSDEHSQSSLVEDTRTLLPTNVTNDEMVKQNSLANLYESEDRIPLPESKTNDISFESILKGIHFHNEEDLQTQLQQFMKKLNPIFNGLSRKESAMPMNDAMDLIMSMAYNKPMQNAINNITVLPDSLKEINIYGSYTPEEENTQSSDEIIAKILPLPLDSLINGDRKRKINNILHHLENMFMDIQN